MNATNARSRFQHHQVSRPLRIEYPYVRGVLRMHGEKPGPAMRIRWKPGRRSWTIEGPVGDIRRQRYARLLENKFGMSRWRASHRAAKYCEEIRTGPGGWLLRDSCHIDAQLCDRLPLRAIVWRSCVDLLRFLFRLSSGIVGDLGRNGRRRRKRRFVHGTTANTSVPQVAVCWPS